MPDHVTISERKLLLAFLLLFASQLCDLQDVMRAAAFSSQHSHGTFESAGARKTSSVAPSKTIKKRRGISHSYGQKADRSRARAEAKAQQRPKLKRLNSPSTIESRKLTRAFAVSTELRSMAQQLYTQRSQVAYAAVQSYAEAHEGEASATAYLAIGHTLQADRRYAEAVTAYRKASQIGDALDDYSDYLAAQAAMQGGDLNGAAELIAGYSAKYPQSIFARAGQILLAKIYIQQNAPNNALRALNTLTARGSTNRSDYQYTLARANQLAGHADEAKAGYRVVYNQFPLSAEAALSRTLLEQLGTAPTALESNAHAYALFEAKRYSEAANEYRSITAVHGLSSDEYNDLRIYIAACDFKNNQLSWQQAEALPDMDDAAGALRLYMLAELLRAQGNIGDHHKVLTEMARRYPKSHWLEEALYSGGNMYLLKRDPAQAIWHYSLLFQYFPKGIYASSSLWRAAWLEYRRQNYPESARLMEEHIRLYPESQETPGALYWRARMFEEQEHNLPQAMNFYHSLSETYHNYYYALLARNRLAILGDPPQSEPSPSLETIVSKPAPELMASLPENDVHLIKARLLANAALNEFIAPEIQASPTASQWGTLAEAEIYASNGETIRSIQAMKRSGIPFFAMPIEEVPFRYWRLLFPFPYQEAILSNAKQNGLNPYLVASLIRQESEFNPDAVSYANAYGLMQLIPSTAKILAKERGVRGFRTEFLFDPTINIQLGTVNLKQLMDRFGDQIEYTLAAYNAGDTAVRGWMVTSDYRDMADFVESIPYTQTREYVEAILRNREMYRQLYEERRPTTTDSSSPTISDANRNRPKGVEMPTP
jgi:soluble lytic murein transglycosylase